MGEKFEEVLPWSDVPKLMKIYEDSGMDYYSPYLFLENVQRWHRSFPECDSFVLCPDGKVDEYGTFMIVYPINHNTANMIFEDKNPDPAAIKPFLQRCIESVAKRWSLLLFGPIEERYWPVLYETASELSFSKLQASFSNCYYMDKEQAKKLALKCPDNVYIAPLKEDHADLINSLWPHQFEDSQKLIQTVIYRNGGLGIYLKENDELVSWGLHGMYNGPGNLQTVENQKRKGFGMLAAIAISRFVAEKGLHPLFFVIYGNTPAHNLYAKLGFNKSRNAQWCLWGKMYLHFMTQKYLPVINNKTD